jgi:hypothetical protein
MSFHITEYDPPSFGVASALLPDQLLNAIVPATGPRALLMAVLLDAIRNYVRYVRSPRPLTCFETDHLVELQAWFASSHADYLYDFCFICHTFELSPKAIRNHLRAQTLPQQPQIPPPSATFDALVH